MADISGLFPQAPAAPKQIDPQQLLGMADGVNKLILFNKDFAARQATGEAYAGARNPDGTYDPNRLASGLARRPETNWNAPETAARTTELQHGQIGNVAAQFDLNARRQGQAIDAYGSIADSPSPEAVRGITANLAARGVPAALLAPMLDRLRRAKSPEEYQGILSDLRKTAIGAAGTAQPMEAPPGPGLTPQKQPLGSFLNPPAAGSGGGRPVGMPVGEEVPAAGAAGRASDLQATGASSPQYHADLENLKQDSKIIGNVGGPTVEVEKKLAQLSSRLGGLLPSTMTPDQLRAVESFDKIANQISTTQAGRLGAATDAGRHMVVGMNPSTSMSSYGREGVIDMLQGNQDMIDRARDSWLEARKQGAPANSFDLFMHGFARSADPRVFQFNRLNRENQQKFLHQLDPSDLPEFEQKYKDAIAQKWVKPLKAAQ
jgi:hypothetical protein